MPWDLLQTSCKFNIFAKYFENVLLTSIIPRLCRGEWCCHAFVTDVFNGTVNLIYKENMQLEILCFAILMSGVSIKQGVLIIQAFGPLCNF